MRTLFFRWRQRRYHFFRVKGVVITDPLDILVLYSPRERSPYNEAGGFEVASRVSSAIAAAGVHSPIELFDLKSLADLGQMYPSSKVINLVYGYKETVSITYTQPETTAMIEKCGLLPIGSASEVQTLAQDKYLCGNVLARAGFTVPRMIVPGEKDVPPFVVRKPRYGAAHRHVSLLRSDQLTSDDIRGDLLLQAYEYGDEYTVGVIESGSTLIALAPLRINFAAKGPCVLGGEAAWDVLPDIEDLCNLKEIAKAVFRQLGMHAFARIDFRVSGPRKCVLDVNTLPNLHPERSFLPIAARAMGWTYGRLVQMIAGVYES